MPLTKVAEKVILTTLACPRCEGVGRLYRKPSAEVPTAPPGISSAEYYYTLRCPNCGDYDLWGVPAKGNPAAGRN